MRLIFETVNADGQVYTLGFDLETDTYDEVVRTVDYFRHVYVLDAIRPDYIMRCIELIEREVAGKATLKDTQEFQRLENIRSQADAFLSNKVNVILLRGNLKDTILTISTGCERLGSLDDIARSLVIPDSVMSIMITVNSAWKRTTSADHAPSALQLAAQKKVEVKYEKPVDITSDIDVDDLPLVDILAKNSKQKQQVPLKIIPSKTTKGQKQ